MRLTGPVFIFLLLASCLPGCGTTKVTGTARSGTEQLILSTSWDNAIQKIDFRPLTGVPVYLDTTNATAQDQGWIVSSIRQAMLTQGVLLRPKPEQAQWVVEARVGAYGTDSYNWLVGVPQVTIPTTVSGMPAGTIPEIPFIKKTDQQAISKLALFAYDRGSGRVTWTSGTALGSANAKDLYLGWIGPIQSGSIRQGAALDGMKLPSAGVLNPYGSSADEKAAANIPFDTPAIRTPTNASDLDAFSPP